MAAHSSNYWKKRAPHKPMEYVDDRIVIWGHNTDLPLIEKIHLYEGQIIPNRMIKDKQVYEITKLHPQFFINGFIVITEQEFVTNIVLFGYHPNRDPDTHLYCLPDYKKGVKYDQKYFDMLLTNIKTYYLDDCFYTPPKNQVEYKRIKSVPMKSSQGEK